MSRCWTQYQNNKARSSDIAINVIDCRVRKLEKTSIFYTQLIDILINFFYLKFCLSKSIFVFPRERQM